MTFRATPAAGATPGATSWKQFYSHFRKILEKNEVYENFLLHLLTKLELKMCQKSGDLSTPAGLSGFVNKSDQFHPGFPGQPGVDQGLHVRLLEVSEAHIPARQGGSGGRGSDRAR